MRTKSILVLLSAAFLSSSVFGQVFTLSRDQMIKYTSKNPYDRFPDGRPKVPDAVLEKVRGLSAEEVILGPRGYPNQFADGLQLLHPGKKLVGRAVTLQLMPTRPDISDVDQADWKAKGNQRRLSHQTVIDMLQAGDVFVVDAFGSLAAGGIVGDNLAYYIWKTTKAGFVIDGAIRDLEGVAPFDMAGYFRHATPPPIRNVMVTGINIPVRIGNVTVMPGDVVMGDREGVSFIPPHLVQEVLDVAEVTHIHDDWTKMKFDEGKYKSTDIYGSPSEKALIDEYQQYLKQKLGAERYEQYIKRQPRR